MRPAREKRSKCRFLLCDVQARCLLDKAVRWPAVRVLYCDGIGFDRCCFLCRLLFGRAMCCESRSAGYFTFSRVPVYRTKMACHFAAVSVGGKPVNLEYGRSPLDRVANGSTALGDTLAGVFICWFCVCAL